MKRSTEYVMTAYKSSSHRGKVWTGVMTDYTSSKLVQCQCIMKDLS